MTIRLLATGGTIASTRNADGAVAIALTGTELLDTVPGLDRSDIDVVDIVHGPSWNLDISQMASIAELAGDALSSGEVTGVVVTHGTDTVEETLWLTDLLAHDATDRGAMVFTASMRNAGDTGGDGSDNLRGAIELARSGSTAGRGAVLFVNGEVHEARWVTKTDAQAVDTFRSFGTRPWRRPPIGARVEPAVHIVRSYGGVPAGIVEWHLEQGARGIVLDATGAGNVNAALRPGIERAIAADVPVVVTTRCLTGEVGPIYGGEIGGHTLAALGVISGAELSAAKARLALAVALGADPELQAVRSWFDILR